MATHRLWSLREMLDKYSSTFNDILAQLQLVHVGMKVGGTNFLGRDRKITEGEAKELSDLLSQVSAVAVLLKSDTLEKYVKDMRESLAAGYLCSELRDDARELKRLLECKLDARSFLYLSPDKAERYNKKESFGSEVSDRFPKAIDDIESAGNCLALGEGTAAVFHLMRVVEVGLKALAGKLGIRHAPNWGAYLTRINEKLSTKPKIRGVRWRRDERFYAEITSDLVNIKRAWRNPTMHVGRRYSIEEAEEIFRTVESFMQRLATQLR